MRDSEAVAALIAAGRDFDARGWLPGGSGNLSARLDDGRVLLTLSGRHKGRLGAEDFTVLDVDADPSGHSPRPSDESLLHLQRYRLDPDCACVLHTHSVAATVLSRTAGEVLTLDGYELVKAFPDIASHTERLAIPVLDNEQDMPALAAEVSRRGIGADALPLYLIRGHGLYSWAAEIERARCQVEAGEFLLECELMQGKQR